MPPNIKEPTTYLCIPDDFVLSEQEGFSLNEKERFSLSKKDDLRNGWAGETPDNFLLMYKRYVIPLRMFFDIVFPNLVTSIYWEIISKYGVVHIVTKVWSIEEYAIYNRDVPRVVASLFFTTILSNFIESILLLKYRGKMTVHWASVLIHHVVLIALFFMFLSVGQYLIILQAAVGFHHLAYWPIASFRHWKSTFNRPQRIALVLYVTAMYTYNHYVHIAAFCYAYGPGKYAYLIFWPLRWFCMFHSVYMFYFDYIVCKSVIRGLNIFKG